MNAVNIELKPGQQVWIVRVLAVAAAARLMEVAKEKTERLLAPWGLQL